jgi:hypothetical protein
MNETRDCEQVRPLLAEVAAGAATGYDLALALGHVAGCPACREELIELTRVADDLLLLTPEREPPAGFETAVVQRIVGLTSHPPRRRWRPRIQPGRTDRGLRLVAALIILLLAVASGAAFALWRTAPDRRLADQYRQTLALAGGRYLKAAQVTTDSGREVGHIFLYEGSPSWITVVLTAAPVAGDYAMSIVTTDGVRYPAGTCQVTGQSATVGYALPVPVSAISAIELVHPGVRLTALTA